MPAPKAGALPIWRRPSSGGSLILRLLRSIRPTRASAIVSAGAARPPGARVMRSPLHRQAYHEAGHGVVAHFRGHRIKRISVKPGTAPAPGHTITYLGRTVIRFDYPDGVVAFAGYHAEKRFCPALPFSRRLSRGRAGGARHPRGGCAGRAGAAGGADEDLACVGTRIASPGQAVGGLVRNRGARRGTRGTRHARGRGGVPARRRRD